MTLRGASSVERRRVSGIKLRPMDYWNLAIAVREGAVSSAHDVSARLTAAWNSSPEALIKIIPIEELDASRMEELDGVVIIVDDAAARHTALVRPLTMLEERHIPVLALLDACPDPASVFEHAAVLVESITTNAAVLCARLHGMLHRQREIDRLCREVAVARRSHLGLGDQVSTMHEELQLAAQAQRELLPNEIPTVHGVSVAALWRPAQYVSGDIYDVMQLDEDHLGLFLADAVGHGVAAALMTMVICQSLITKVKDGSSWRILDPADVLGRLNAQMISSRVHPSRFATAVYGVIDCRNRRLALAGAGHPSPLLVRGNGPHQPLETCGGLLGVFEDETYDQIEVNLSVGDRLLLYTDGFEQAFPTEGKGTRTPTSRYREEFQLGCESDTPQDMIESICGRLDSQAGSLHQIDDLTLLCMQAGPLTHDARQSVAA